MISSSKCSQKGVLVGALVQRTLDALRSAIHYAMQRAGIQLVPESPCKHESLFLLMKEIAPGRFFAEVRRRLQSALSPGPV